MIEFKVNGQLHRFDADADTPLLYFLRDELELNGARFGCGLGQCGACTVLVDGAPVLSCVTPLLVLAGREVTTLEGLGSAGGLSQIQQAFVAEQAAQCGYCSGGMIMRAQALLLRQPDATEAQIRAHLQPNLCRCGTHVRIIRAVKRAAALMQATKATASGAQERPPSPPPQPDEQEPSPAAGTDVRTRPAQSGQRERPER